VLPAFDFNDGRWPKYFYCLLHQMDAKALAEAHGVDDPGKARKLATFFCQLGHALQETGLRTEMHKNSFNVQ
jgi:hypothetical protein